MGFFNDFLTYNPMTAGVYNGYNALSGSNLLDDVTKKPQYLGPSPYAGQWNDLIAQLRNQAKGVGPSLAEQEYRAASQTALGQQAALSHGRNQGAARQAANNMSAISLGQAEGVTRARTNEQTQAQQSLNAALAAANQADYQRQYANQQAYLQTPTQFQQLMSMGGQLASTGAAMSGGGAPMPMMAPAPMSTPNAGGMQAPGVTWAMANGMVPQNPVPMQYDQAANNLTPNYSGGYQPAYAPWGNGGY